jgi:multiple RNA-binding domain-containing protein 1
MSSRICVKNLSKSTGEKELREVFSKRGEITDVKLMKTAAGVSRRFAFIGFRTGLQAQEAASYFNNTYISSSRITIEIAKKVGDSELVSAKNKYSKKSPTEDSAVKSDKKEREIEEKLQKTKAQPVVVDKDKLDFLEAMKHRRNAQFWTNDTAQQHITDLGDSQSDQMEDSTTQGNIEDYSESESESESAINKKNGTVAVKEANKAVRPVTDLNYLKSKNKWTDSDSDSDSSSSSDSNSSSSAGSSSASTGRNRRRKGGTEHLVSKKEEKSPTSSSSVIMETNEGFPQASHRDGDEDENELDDTGRLFVRNLPFSCSEEELKECFEPFGPISSIHITLDADKRSKGFAFVHFLIPEDAEKATLALDGSSFQGRVLHIIRAKRMKEEKTAAVSAEVHSKGPKLSTFQLKREEERKKLAGKKEGWNAAFVRSDTVVGSLADRFGVKHSEIMDTAASAGGDLAVRLAIGEAKIVQVSPYVLRTNYIISIMDHNCFAGKHGILSRARGKSYSYRKLFFRSQGSKTKRHNTFSKELTSRYQ